MYAQSARPGEGGGETLNLDVLATTDTANGWPEVVVVTGATNAIITNPAYCSPIYEFHGEAVFGEFTFNDSGLAGDVNLKVGAQGTVTGSSAVLDSWPAGYHCESASRPVAPTCPRSTCSGTFVRSGGVIVAIDFNRSYTWFNGIRVTTNGRLSLLP